LHDYSNVYAAMRMKGIDQDKAKELAADRLRSEWGVSDAAGGQLMKHPPEGYYKPVGGSRAWMQEQLQDFVTSLRGPAVTVMNEGTPQALPVVNWSVKGLVADSTTQADIAAGRPPSYRVAIDTGKGQVEFLTDRATGRDRVTWDQKAAEAAYDARWKGLDARQRMLRDVGAAMGQGVTP
jgi:hypothetical protein